MHIISGNIILRAIEKKDNEILKELINDPDTESKVGGWSFPSSDERQLQWYQDIAARNDPTVARFAVEVDGECVGMAGIHGIDYKNSNAGVDIKLVREIRGRGIGCSVVRMLEAYAFDELNLHVLVAEVLEGNVASRRIFEKAGFTLDGIMRKRIYKNGRYHNRCVYSVLKEEHDSLAGSSECV